MVVAFSSQEGASREPTLKARRRTGAPYSRVTRVGLAQCSVIRGQRRIAIHAVRAHREAPFVESRCQRCQSRAVIVAGGDEVSETDNFPASVVEASSDRTVVVNRGSLHGVETGQRFVVYRLSREEIQDPESGEYLGRLERVVGVGEIVNVQDRLCTLELDYGSSRPRTRVGRRSAFQAFPGLERREAAMAGSSDQIEVGDRVKPV